MAKRPQDILKEIAEKAGREFHTQVQTESQAVLRNIANGVRRNFGLQGEVVGGKTIQTTFDETEPSQSMDDSEFDDEPYEGESPAQLFTAQKHGADDTLSIAVAAWRMLAPDANSWIVAQNSRTGEAFCGRPSDLSKNCRQNRQADDDWTVWEGEPEDSDEESIWDLVCDKVAARSLLSKVALDKYDVQARDYAKQHLGDSPTLVQHLAIAGVTAPLTHFGVLRGTAYTAKKEGEIDNYFHVHGKETGVFPSIYRLDDHTLIIHSPVELIKDGWLDD
jgi:hypothetical protein